MTGRKIKIGVFSFNHDEFCEWHDSRYKAIRTPHTVERGEFLSKLTTAPREWFFDNFGDTTCNYAFTDLLTGIKAAPENDDRTKDLTSLRARMAKLCATDDVYTVIPASRVAGREGIYQETGHLHMAVYCAIIDGVITLEEEITHFIPLHWTVKVSRRVSSIPFFIQKINSHDNKADFVKDAHLNRMEMANSNLMNYSDHIISKNGTTLVKALTGKSRLLDLFSAELEGPLFKAYLDSTVNDHNDFANLSVEANRLMDQGLIGRVKVNNTQVGFTIGFLVRIKQYIEEGMLTQEQAVSLIREKMVNPNALNDREKRALSNTARMIYNVPLVDLNISVTHTAARHRFVGQIFAVECFNNREGYI